MSQRSTSSAASATCVVVKGQAADPEWGRPCQGAAPRAQCPCRGGRAADLATVVDQDAVVRELAEVSSTAQVCDSPGSAPPSRYHDRSQRNCRSMSRGRHRAHLDSPSANRSSPGARRARRWQQQERSRGSWRGPHRWPDTPPAAPTADAPAHRRRRSRPSKVPHGDRAPPET